jgi:Helix-turn-helix domain/Cell wall synthesis protein CwsA
MPSMKQDTGTGIGRALRAARQRQGKSLETAGRETRVRPDYLDALEREDFDALGSDVYVRSFLRSYARYLGLSHEKVIAAYERAFGREAPAPAPVERTPGVGPTEAVILTEKKRPPWFLAGMAAAILFGSAAAIGILNRSSAVPEPADVSRPPAVPVMPQTVEVGVTAHQDNDFEVVIDDEAPLMFRLEEGEARSFEASDAITIHASEGGIFDLFVNGKQASSGDRHAPFENTFTPDSFREGSSPPSPGA